MHLYFYAGQQRSDLEQLLQTLDALIAQVIQAVARVVTVQTFALAISWQCDCGLSSGYHCYRKAAHLIF